MNNFVFLRIYYPQIYGWYLVFKNSIPVTCINKHNFDLLSNYHQNSSLKLENIKLFMQYFGTDILENDFKMYEVDPAVSTIIKDDLETEFITSFYKYFGEILQVGSPLIDSDMEYLPLLKRYFPSQEDFVCGDLGAGSGKYAAALCSKVKKVYACDIEVSRLNAQVLPVNLITTACNIQQLPFVDDFFDFLMCNYVLEHVGDPYAVISEMIRTLKPSGHLLLALPSFCYNDMYGARFHDVLPTLNFEHLRSYTGITGIHPWEESSQKVVDYILDHNCDIIEVRGADITIGLDERSLFKMLRFLDIPEFSSSNIYPYNYYGSQTIIYAKKK